MPRLSAVAEALPRSQIREVMELAWAAERAGRKVFHLEVGQPDLRAPEEAIEATRIALDDPVAWKYCPNAGELRTRELVAEFIEERTGCPTASGQILIGIGATSCIATLFSVILDAGDEILLPNPFWPNCDMSATLFRAIPVSYRMPADRGFLPDLAEVEALITPRTKAMYIGSPSNPTGKVFPKETLEALVRMCVRRNIFLISDEIYGEIIFEEKLRGASVLSCAAMREAEEHVLWLGGVSKAFAMTGFRVGFTRAPPRVISLLEKNQEALLSCGVPFAQRGAAAALRSARMPEVLQNAVATYGRRRDLAVAALMREGLPLPRHLVPEGAFYMLVPCGPQAATDVSMEVAQQLLEAEGVACAPGGTFGSEAENFLRVSFATSDADLEEGVTRLARFLKQRRGADEWWPTASP